MLKQPSVVIFIVLCLGVKNFVLLVPFVGFIFLVKVTEWPPIGKIASHSACDMFSWYKYLIVNLVFSHLIFMPPTLKKLEGHIAFGLSVCVSVCLSVC